MPKTVLIYLRLGGLFTSGGPTGPSPSQAGQMAFQSFSEARQRSVDELVMRFYNRVALFLVGSVVFVSPLLATARYLITITVRPHPHRAGRHGFAHAGVLSRPGDLGYRLSQRRDEPSRQRADRHDGHDRTYVLRRQRPDRCRNLSRDEPRFLTAHATLAAAGVLTGTLNVPANGFVIAVGRRARQRTTISSWKHRRHFPRHPRSTPRRNPR